MYIIKYKLLNIEHIAFFWMRVQFVNCV